MLTISIIHKYKVLYSILILYTIQLMYSPIFYSELLFIFESQVQYMWFVIRTFIYAYSYKIIQSKSFLKKYTTTHKWWLWGIYKYCTFNRLQQIYLLIYCTVYIFHFWKSHYYSRLISLINFNLILQLYEYTRTVYFLRSIK